jgi:hypothetical protein
MERKANDANWVRRNLREQTDCNGRVTQGGGDRDNGGDRDTAYCKGS